MSIAFLATALSSKGSRDFPVVFSVEAFTLLNPTKVFLQHALIYLPESFFHIIEHLPIKSLQRLRAILDQSTRVARELVEQNSGTIASMERNNMLRLLGEFIKVFIHTRGSTLFLATVQANASEQSTSRLSDEELLAQMRYAVRVIVLIDFAEIYTQDCHGRRS